MKMLKYFKDIIDIDRIAEKKRRVTFFSLLSGIALLFGATSKNLVVAVPGAIIFAISLGILFRD
ncbi:MAG: hypothetical protein Q4A23_00170 [bacterium]|nr:hypothetical protein [bacterium]